MIPSNTNKLNVAFCLENCILLIVGAKLVITSINMFT